MCACICVLARHGRCLDGRHHCAADELSVFPSVRPSVHSSVRPPVSPSVRPFVRPSVRPLAPVRPSVRRVIPLRCAALRCDALRCAVMVHHAGMGCIHGTGTACKASPWYSAPTCRWLWPELWLRFSAARRQPYVGVSGVGASPTGYHHACAGVDGMRWGRRGAYSGCSRDRGRRRCCCCKVGR
jgi:hypothetical protein